MPESTREQFNGLFAQLAGEWQVTIRDLDDAGSSRHEAHQVRRFTWVVGARFVEEKAFVLSPDSVLVNIGVILYSFDDSTSQVRLISFWPRSPRPWAEFTGCVDLGARHIRGSITSRRPNEPVRIRRVEMVLESPARFLWRGIDRSVDGREYVAEELTYERSRPGGR